MRGLAAQFEKARTSVRFVVIGNPQEAASFCGRFGDASLCLSDPEKRTYKAMGLEQYSLPRLFSDPALRRRHTENKAAGFRQDWAATRLKNAAQLPGAAVVDSRGIVRWIHRAAHPGDLPPMSEMLVMVRRYAPA